MVASVWDVVTYGIPLTGQGKELTVNWQSYDINNNNTFYTDSNALEMQERVLNYRPTWTVETNQNVTANYYPVNSAIAIVDEEKNLQMTIMNDRSQGGTVLKNGRVELMQNRRLFFDDDRGVEEALNETDSFGNGITVPATYHLHLFDRTVEESAQRYIQMMVDEPLQYFFTFNWTKSEEAATRDHLNLLMQPHHDHKQLLPIKYQMFPVKRNTLFIRFENIGDNFDNFNNKTLNDTSLYIDVKDFAERLYHHINANSSELNNINIVETGLTGNEPYSDMVANKVKWHGEDDEKLVQPERLADKSGFEVAL